MRRLLFALSILLLPAGLRAEDGLDHARQARALLGPGVWSRVIRIENQVAKGRYPRRVDALVFELAGILWFYTDSDGTQSLSQFTGRLPQDEADFGPLLRAIDPGFTSWTVVPEGMALSVAERGPLPFGCLEESVALLRERLALGAELIRPRLLFYYVKTPAGLGGHTVLSYETADGFRVVDPETPRRAWRIRRAKVTDAQSLADSLRNDVATARWLAISDFPAPPLGRYASTGSAVRPAG